MTVAPAVGWIALGPKSGTRSGFVPISSRARSNSPRRMSARLTRSGRVAAFSYRKTGMPSSLPTRAPRARARATQSSMVVPSRGMKGQTSVAPMRGCSPWWVRRSMRSRARAMPRNAASTTRSAGATNVTTVRLWEASLETSRMAAPPADAMASVMAFTTSGRRPSEKLGTHSTRPGNCDSGVTGDGWWVTALRAQVPQQPGVHGRVSGDHAGPAYRDRRTGRVGDDAAGFAYQQDAGGNVPRGEHGFPEGVEPPGGDGGEVERGGAGAPDTGRSSHHARKLADVGVHIFHAGERESGTNERSRGVVDVRHADGRPVHEGAAAADGRERFAERDVNDHA